jgi:hypothetical protein
MEQRGFLGVCIVFNYVHILHGSFPRVSGVCSVFLFDVMSDGGKVSCIYCVLSVQGTTSSYYQIVVVLIATRHGTLYRHKNFTTGIRRCLYPVSH